MTVEARPTMTGVVVPVPEADHLVDHAHVTVLAPFGRDNRPTAEEIDELARFFADVTPFAFTLTGESVFPSGIRYLSPEPAATFSRLTHQLHRLFPEYPPYGGQFDIVVPHLTIPMGVTVASTPIRAHARAAMLMHHDAAEGYTTVMARFPFGTSAA